VIFENERQENRRAAFLYLVVAHVGAIAILLSSDPGRIFQPSPKLSRLTFDAMRTGPITHRMATAAFFLSFFGFAAKGGVISTQSGLPGANPVAPSNVSALMSGVMLKTAIYGIVRVNLRPDHVFPGLVGGNRFELRLISAVMACCMH